MQADILGAGVTAAVAIEAGDGLGGTGLEHAAQHIYGRGPARPAFFGTQSLIRDDIQRSLLHDMDNAIQRLNETNADELARRSLIGCYHNLVRQWSDT